ncbi:TonB-dependent receptor plug domain-containing protein [Congregicoccus parvus]|uniref:TonB-dependent receptor plug domain-containing protein n=1 Tax=Congregicoccus parvus TaxID=3081749 RepID=UPI003FA57CF6
MKQRLRLPKRCRPTAVAAISVVLAVSGARAQSSESSSGAEVIELSPFEVSADDDSGYRATRTMSGTRLNTKLEDLAASISVVTKEQLLDTAAIDINDIFLYEGNTEGTHQYTDFQVLPGTGATGDTIVDNTSVSPTTANRIRGMGTANLSIGGFERSNLVPIDTYNIDRVEISRGPNSNIFGLGGAAGTVNLVTGSANLSRTSARASFRGDDRGGWRVEGDYNMPMIEDVLAMRVTAMYEDKGFTREPAYSKTVRQNIGLSFKPWTKTLLRVSYENFDNRSSTPNAITPTDLVTPWIEAGTPTWNPLTRTLTRADGTVLASGVTWNNRASQLLLPGYGVDMYNDAFANRVNQFIDAGEMSLYTIGRMVGVPSGTGAAGPITAQTQTGYYLASGQEFDAARRVLWRPLGVTDRGIYDYENINFSAPNFETNDAWDVRGTLEQEILRTETHQLSAQAAYYKQKVDKNTRNFIAGPGGIPPNLMIDINETLLDGSPNPFFLRPFMAGSEPQKRWILDDNETMRGQLAYVFDPQNKPAWLQWFGRQSVLGYGEKRERISGTLGFRDYVTSAHDWLPEYNTNGTIRNKVSTGYRQTVRYYMGDANGYDIDYAPQRIAETAGWQDLYWYNARQGAWVTEPVFFEELHDSGRMKSESRYTFGYVWQGSFWNDRIIPTYGWRNDRLTEFEGPSRTWDEFGYPYLPIMWEFNDPDFDYNKSYSEGDTTTAGVVVKPTDWLFLHYNQSDSFRPAGIAYDVYRNILPNPTGEGKDYGFTLVLLDRKLTLKYNQYETLELNARTGGSSSTMTSRLQRIDFDISRSEGRLPDSGDRFNLEAQAYRWILAENRIVPGTVLEPAQAEAYRDQAWSRFVAGLDQEYRDWFMDGPTRVFADTNRAEGRGRELEIAYTPNRYFTAKASITQTKAIDSGVSEANTAWMAERLPFWESVTIPDDFVEYNTATQQWEASPRAGQSWWTTRDPVSNTIPQEWFLTNVDSPMALINASAGQSKPQVREWKFNTTMRYNLAGLGTENFLKNMTVGASARWVDKGAVGYLALEPELPSPDYVYYRYDASKPVYDKAVTEFDFMVSYRFKLNEKVRGLVQLNVRNAFEDGGLRVVGVNPDGEARNFRIVDPRLFTLTTTFEL